jgi:hypothetical protein
MADQNTRTIRVSESAWKYLNAHKDPGDTFADATDKVLDEHDHLKFEAGQEMHRLADAEPREMPSDAPRDENDDPILQDNE